jgi:uncharacterized circularly permuted ATP-grasp superfamily protein
MLDMPLVRLDDLSVRGGRLMARAGKEHIPVDVVYRRTDEDSLTNADGELTDVGAALIEPLSYGTLSCVNAFGAGIADDKLIHAYVEEMVRYYLGEEPLLPSVRTYDPCDEALRAEILDRIDEQELVTLSTHPTAIDGRLEPRHIDLRPFAFAGDDVEVAPGGITRVALDRGALVVNASQRGGAKDTWVMA